jgi:DNA ligase-1
MKPMLADDWDPAAQRFPILAMPKIDGVRGLNLFGKLTGRSLKPFKNRHITRLFSHSALIGFDGEFAANKDTHPDLCRLTTSALGTIEGLPYVLWHLFDYVTVETVNLPYWQRLKLLRGKVEELHVTMPLIAQHLRVVPATEFGAMEGLETFKATCADAGYEGVILRDPNAPHKSGRSTIREGGYLRIKAFMDAEGVVTALQEGQTNNNEATTNALGHTERSTHQANMVANGLVGTLTVKLLAQVKAGDKVFEAGELITIAAGKMTSEERAFYLLHPGEIVGRVVKFQYFPHGVKDKLRFPTFQSIRMKEDM